MSIDLISLVVPQEFVASKLIVFVPDEEYVIFGAVKVLLEVGVPLEKVQL